jgi:hypothetical protein
VVELVATAAGLAEPVHLVIAGCPEIRGLVEPRVGAGAEGAGQAMEVDVDRTASAALGVRDRGA